ncbi:MAG: SUMF1/EgtB/PvdO family nonheme iron enzyme [Saprospiraceae bacterium]|nr:SUMF1/EgtB/PvdO family nonheme iron enzyme [Saprospiraceae bacterium]
MKKWMLFLLPALYCLPLFANSGDFENRLREAELAGDAQRAEAVCKEWLASGQYSAGLLNWNYNALMSVEENALLFTQQESDTYPALLLQYALDVRPDVRVLSIQLLDNAAYRSLVIGSEGWNWIPKDCSLKEMISQLLQPKTTRLSPAKPIYFGSMTHKNQLPAGTEKWYLTGLAMKFSNAAFDNVAALRNNFENRFRTDYLEFSFEPEKDPETLARVNLHYIPALVLLHRHYTAAGETGKADRIQILALRIGETGGRAAEVRALFAPETPASPVLSALTPKILEKPMKKVSHNLYAAETELTNAQYDAFLTDLVKNKDFEQLNLCKTTKTDWISLLPKELQTLSQQQLFRHGHPDDPEMPVQNISHEAALRYCAWITQVYNASPEKKKFKKVIFRLPNEAEWMTAARGGLPDLPYPWPGGYTVQNSKGCYLGNYNTTEPCGDCPEQAQPVADVAGNPIVSGASPKTTAADIQKLLGPLYDGGFFTVPAASYYSNKFGLYAVSGNVAEMLDEAGKTKGGSWQDEAYYGQISPVKNHTLPSPAVGFRVFMEVIEE